MADLVFTIRTPQGTVIDEPLSSARVPTSTGQVGLRPAQEAMALPVESGLIVLRTRQGTRLVATAGGLLSLEHGRAVLYTPFAEAGESETELLEALERAFAAPGGELESRRRLAALEQRIVQELRPRASSASVGFARGSEGTHGQNR